MLVASVRTSAFVSPRIRKCNPVPSSSPSGVRNIAPAYVAADAEQPAVQAVYDISEAAHRNPHCRPLHDDERSGFASHR